MYLTTPRGASAGYGEVIEAVGLGIAVFTTGQQLLTSGSFSNSTSTVNYMHERTPLTQRFRSCAMEFSLRAHHPRYFIDPQVFWYRLSFEYNGNDLRNVAIHPLVNRSSTLQSSTFSTTWSGQAHSPQAAPVAEVMFQLAGRWDPVGRGDVSFNGDLLVTAAGRVRLNVRSELDWVTVGTPPTACALATPWTPPAPRAAVRVPITNFVFFAPGSDRVVEADERRLMAWLIGLAPGIKASIARGDSPIRVEGYASTTAGGPANLVLSRRRAERVARLIRDALGSQTSVNVLARGEYTARTADRVEAQSERRAVVTIDHLVSPATSGGVNGYGGYGGYAGVDGYGGFGGYGGYGFALGDCGCGCGGTCAGGGRGGARVVRRVG